jgi:hypothetical protein
MDELLQRQPNSHLFRRRLRLNNGLWGLLNGWMINPRPCPCLRQLGVVDGILSIISIDMFQAGVRMLVAISP